MEYHSFLYKPIATLLYPYILFPSPYGVSFILIRKCGYSIEKEYYDGFRLLMEYHSFLSVSEFEQKAADNLVSVSLWSIIHSYV